MILLREGLRAAKTAYLFIGFTRHFRKSCPLRRRSKIVLKRAGQYKCHYAGKDRQAYSQDHKLRPIFDFRVLRRHVRARTFRIEPERPREHSTSPMKIAAPPRQPRHRNGR